MQRDTYQTITDTILAKLENCQPWERPWAGPMLSMPINAHTGKEYRGTNIVMLWASAQEQGFDVNEWATFKQWAERGAKVRKGEKGTPVLWFKMLERRGEAAEAGEDEATGKVPCARISWVFNAAQVEGYTPKETRKPSQVESIEQAEALMLASGAKIRHGGNQAFYMPSRDEVVLPAKESFTGTSTSTATECYYSTAFHELTHWTGPRLNREFGKRFGDDQYAAEELVAELGAAFLCAKVGMSSEPREDHANYLACWIKVLKNDRKAFITAASKASEAADYLLSLAAPAELAA